MTVSTGFDVANLPVYLLCCVGVLANMMLLIAFIKNPLKCFRNSAAYLVGNLAISDSLYCLSFMVNISLEHMNNIVDHFESISFYSSMVTIFSIALDRFLMIRYPFKHRILMSGKKMAAWIAIIWFVSSVHPLKRIFVTNDIDTRVKPGIGSGLIILTGILYGKTYLALKRQNRSIAGKKAVFSLRQDGNSAKESALADKEICFRIECKNERAENERAQLPNGRVQSLSDQNREKSARRQDQRAQSEKERDDESQYQRALGDNERAEKEDERAEKECCRDQRAQSQVERAEYQHYRAKNQDNRAKKQLNIQNELTTNSVTICKVILPQNPSSKTHKKLQPVNNAREQNFLNTIIIIACIAVITVLLGTIGAQLHEMVHKELPETWRIYKSVVYTLYCLNFAVNPFVYCLRLKQYRKTFQIVYGCRR